jgi:hypothetical protein
MKIKTRKTKQPRKSGAGLHASPCLRVLEEEQSLSHPTVQEQAQCIGGNPIFVKVTNRTVIESGHCGWVRGQDFRTGKQN